MRMRPRTPASQFSPNGRHPPDSNFAASIATRYLSAAAYLRRAMLPAEITELGRAAPRQPLPVGRPYAWRVLFHADGALPMSAVNIGKVRKHCRAALWQTLIRDMAAIAALACAAFLEPWGTLIVLAALVLGITLFGRVRWSSPLVIAAAVGVAFAFISGGPHGRDTYLVPLICLGACFVIYMADSLWSVRCVRKLWREFPSQQQSPTPLTPMAALPPPPLDQQAAGFMTDGRNGNHRGSSVTSPRKVYYDKYGIVGAGTPFTPLPLTVPLDKPLAEDDEIKTFTGVELLTHIGHHLLTQGVSDGQVHGKAHNPLSLNGDQGGLPDPSHFTYGLPYLNVGTVVAVPFPRGKKRPFRASRVVRLDHPDRSAAEDIAKVANRSPSVHPERHYLRASTTSWDGQIVASVYVSAALQGHYLRVVVWPYVLAPIAADLKVADELAERHMLLQVGVAGLWTLRQFVAGAKRLNGLLRKTGKSRQARPTMEGIRSTRERYAQIFTDNVHQAEDSDRLIRIMELKVVRVTMAFLRECNIDIEEYEKQVLNNVQNNIIIGTGNIATGGTFNNSSVNATGDGNKKPDGTGSGGQGSRT